MADAANKKFSYRIQRISIGQLKGIKKLDYTFGNHAVTAILGVNGSGKTTILHALACVYRPMRSASKSYNRLSDFFKTNPDANWNGSRFTVYYDYREQESPQSQPVDKTGHETYSKKSQSWSPKYIRRPIYESTYIGLQNLQTGADDPSSYRYRGYETKELAHEAAEQIKKDMVSILGRSYDRLNHHLVKSSSSETLLWGLEFDGVRYSELSMGAGEKRVLNILSALHHPLFKKGGLLVIDELDALLHEASFSKLVSTIVRTATNSKYPLQVVFTTHRETISKFSKQINICSILNTQDKTLALPYVDPDVMMQLTGVDHRPIEIYVEDDLSLEIISNLIYSLHASQYIYVARFGVASNAFGLVAGKILLGHDVSSTICVLDGDVFLSSEERESEIKRHLGGNDKTNEREVALGCIKQYSLANQLQDGVKGAPEYNHKLMFEKSNPKTEQLKRLQQISKTINNLSDWHEYYDELARLSGIRKCRDHILEFLPTTDGWSDYVGEINEWITSQLLKHGFTEKNDQFPLIHGLG